MRDVVPSYMETGTNAWLSCCLSTAIGPYHQCTQYEIRLRNVEDKTRIASLMYLDSTKGGKLQLKLIFQE